MHVHGGERVGDVNDATERKIDPAGDDDDALADGDEHSWHGRVHDRGPLEDPGESAELAMEKRHVEGCQRNEDREREDEWDVLRESVLKPSRSLRWRSLAHGVRCDHAGAAFTEAATIASASALRSSSATTRPSRMTSTRLQSWAISSVSLE